MVAEELPSVSAACQGQGLMSQNSLIVAFSDFARLATRQRGLILEMTRREISDRYAGQVLGTLWAVGHPLFLMALYVFVFGHIFKVQIASVQQGRLDYTTYLMSGLVAWLAFQETMMKSCAVISSNASLVKQVVFPFEILPVKSVLASLITQAVSLGALVIYVAFILRGRMPAMYLMLPFVFGSQLLALIGMAYVLSAIGAYLRDLKDLIQLLATAGVYLIPAFYLPDWVPPMVKPLLYLNPFSYFIWCYQDVLFFTRFAHPWAWLVTPMLSLLTFYSGYRLFMRLKPHFGSIL
jgi:lipopolysaccharide transport system permease protein